MKNLNSTTFPNSLNFPNSPTPLYVYIDEAWRDPIAGPVVVGLVIGSESTDRSWYADSKSLSARQREMLANKIKSDPSIVRATGSASAKEIDRNGIIWALRWAVIRGLYHLMKHMSPWQGRPVGSPKGWNTLGAGVGGGLWKQCYRKQLVEQIKLLTLNFTPLTLIIDWNHTFWLDIELWITVQTIIKWDRDILQIVQPASLPRRPEMLRWSNYEPNTHDMDLNNICDMEPLSTMKQSRS
jgi:hypothetical protein